MAMYNVQQKVVTWQQKYVEAPNFEQAVAMAVELDDWQGMYDVDEALDTFWVQDEDTNASGLYGYTAQGQLEKVEM